MRNKKILLLGILTALLALTVVATAAGPLADSFSIPWWTVDGGGGSSQGGAYTLKGTVGQADAGTISGGNFSLTGGYWSITMVVFRIYLPVTQR